MKKLVIAAICCITLSLSNVWAQDQAPRRGPHMGEINVQLADTTITSRMQLTPEQNLQIRAINQQYAESVKAKMQAPSNDQQPTREELIQRMNEMLVLRQAGYEQLRKVLGTESYITYLENALMRAEMRPSGFGGRRGPGGEGDGQRRGRGRNKGQGQMQMPEGFGGGEMPQMGGGFGDDF